jgi:hypothetical protein
VPAVAFLLSVVVGYVAFGPPGRSLTRATPAEEKASPPPANTSVARPVGPLPDIPTLQAGWVKAENAKTGATDWRLNNPHPKDGAMEGYANTVSAQRGETVTLFISTRAHTYTVAAYRMGFYGGAGARLLWTSPRQTGTKQSPPTVTRGVNMVETSWHPSLTVTIDPSWPPGDYLFKLVGDTGVQNFIPLTVRDDASTSDLLVMNSVTTWQAYNLWGGSDLYSGVHGRSDIVSFDRPYRLNTNGDGSGDFLGNEFPMVSLIESLGLDVSYTTDVDLDLHPELVLHHHAFISLGHDEYWSTAMRTGAETARAHGVNLAFFGANAVYRHIRFGPSPLGPDRHEINYRSARTDPDAGVDNAEVTVSWREPPVNKPENTVLGELYQCNPVHADLIVTNPTAWVYAGTGLPEGARIPGVVGSEYDQYIPGLPGPPNVELMAHSPLRCRNQPGYSDFTYYAAPSGAGVVDTGTNLWVPFLTNQTNALLVLVTENILTAFAAGPAGTAHPSTSNYASQPKGKFPPTSAGGSGDAEEGLSTPSSVTRPESTTTSPGRTGATTTSGPPTAGSSTSVSALTTTTTNTTTTTTTAGGPTSVATSST